MKKTPKRSVKTKPKKEETLRQRSERLLLENPSRIVPEDLPRLVNELQVHQIELEIQNQELREAQEKLQESRKRYYELYDFAPIGYITLSPSGVVQESNLAAAEMLGVVRSRLLGKLLHGFVLPDDLFLFQVHRESVLGGKGKAGCELRLKTQDRVFFCRMESACAVDGDGNPVSIRSALVDITERIRAEEALRNSEANLRAIFDSAEEGILTLDCEQRVFKANRAAGLISGIPHDQLKGRFLAELVDPSFYFPSAWENFLKIGRFHGEVGIRHSDGSLRIVLVSGIANIDVGQHLFVAHDITERKNMEEKIRKSRDDLEIRVKERTVQLEKEIKKRMEFEEMLRASAAKMGEEAKKRRLLSARLVDLLEKDRRSVAMALHDQLGQSLATLSMDIESVAMRNDPEASREALARVKEKAGEIMASVRDISHALRPAALDTVGVTATLEALVAELKRNSGTEIVFFHGNIPNRLGKDRTLCVYRIAQEALTNALKHASAEHIFVNLIQIDNVLCLTVEDDGKGFDQSAVEIITGGPLGIEIMKERAVDVGGSLRIDSHPGRGTLVIAEIPIAGDDDEPKR
jgi:PAS domain S-box-containing protein